MYCKTKAFIFILCVLSSLKATAQKLDSISFSLVPRLTFYTFEKEAELLLHVPPGLRNSQMTAILSDGSAEAASWSGIPGGSIARIRMPVSFSIPRKITCSISVTGRQGILYTASARIMKLEYKPNEVKTDNLTGSLIVNRKNFFPFGFYCYSPVHPTLAEEEAVKGFNMMSPYQKILPETMHERKAYMDRCAQLGMKVHYNLLSVSGGGGVGSKIEGITEAQKRELLVSEIKTFMDHPALLAWYISDEPNGYKIPPPVLEEIYNLIRSIDPWHPVTMVFMAPFTNAKNYAKALDIVMADPYPVPVRPVTQVGEVTRQLKAEFAGKKPVWIVPQAFGGGEWWEREPTLQELRSMTWQAIIRGATGIQYFVRQGMNYFPKSAASWGECGRMATEVAELTPWLLSDDTAYPVESSNSAILVTSRKYRGFTVVLAVNTKNEPLPASIIVKGLGSGKANVLFENRVISYTGGVIRDQLAPFGTKAFLISPGLNPGISGSQGLSPGLRPTLSTNMIKDPGFEDLTAPGLPSACYARPGGDRGATFFLDSRDSYEGIHSLRLVTPAEDKSAAIRFFPVPVKAGRSYSISLWARSDPEQRFKPSAEQKLKPQYAEVQLGTFIRARFVPDEKWREYVTFVTIPTDTTATVRTNLILKMPGQGVGWFDMVKVIEEK